MSKQLVPSQSGIGSTNSSSDEWSTHKAIISELYLSRRMTLTQVRQYMLEQHNLEKSVQQYQRIFKKWKFTKNTSAAQYQEIKDSLKRKRLDPSDASVTIGNRFLSNKKLRRELPRRLPDTLADKWLPKSSSLLERVSAPGEAIVDKPYASAVITVRPALNAKFTPRSVKNTPWIRFTNILNKKLAKLSQHQGGNSNSALFKLDKRTCTTTSTEPSLCSNLSVVSDLSQNAISENVPFSEHNTISLLPATAEVPQNLDISTIAKVLPNIEAVVMNPFANIGSFRLAADDGKLVGLFNPDFWVLPYLMANNLWHTFPGLDLQDPNIRQSWEVLVPLLQANSTIMTKAIVYQLVVTSCRSLDTRLLRRLIRAGVDVDSIVPSKDRGAVTVLQYTLAMHTDLQRVSISELTDFVSMLLNAGADPNKCGCLQCSSELDMHDDHPIQGIQCRSLVHHCCAASPLGILAGTNDSNNQVHVSGIVELLLNAGAQLCVANLTRLIECRISSAYLQKFLEKALASGCKINVQQFAGLQFWSPVQAALAVLEDVHIAKLLQRTSEWHNVTLELFDVANRPRRLSSLSPSSNAWRSTLALAFGLDEDFAIGLVQAGVRVDGCYFDYVGYVVRRIESLRSGILRPEGRLQGDDVFRWMQLRKSEILRPTEGLHITALQAAVNSGSLRGMRALVRAGVSRRCCHGTPPLVIAVRKQQHDIVQLLLASGVDPNKDKLLCDSRVWHLSPLAEASARGYVSIMSTLLDAGADINKCDHLTGFTPLQTAIMFNQGISVQLLLANKDLDVSHPGSKRGVDALTAAIMQEDSGLLRKLLDRVDGPGLLSADVKGRMLIAAARASSQEFAILVRGFGVRPSVSSVIHGLNQGIPYSMLLNPEVDLRCRKEKPCTADILFSHAIETGKIEFARYILDQGANISQVVSSGLLWDLLKTPVEPGHLQKDSTYTQRLELVLACRNWSVWLDEQSILGPLIPIYNFSPSLRLVVDSALQRRESLANVHFFGDDSPMLACMKFGLTNLLWSLLECGLSPDASVYDDSLRVTLAPLQYACAHKKMDILRLLLTYGANPNSVSMISTDSLGPTPNGAIVHPMVTALELICGAELDRVYGVWQCSPSIYRRDPTDLEIVQMLLSAGADPNLSLSLNRESALTIAARWGSVDIVSELIAAGAFINEPAPAQNFSRTPLQAASAHGHLDVVVMLINYGADVNVAAGPNYGITALQAAAIGGYCQIVQILLGIGADIAAPASRLGGRTAIDGAAEHGRLDIVKFLLDEYEGPESLADICQRAASFARREGHMAVWELLTTYSRSDDDPVAQPEAVLVVDDED